MSLVALILISSQFVTPNNAFTDTEIIDTNSPNQYNHTEIKCSGSRNCQVICDEDRSCSGATITCPEHFPCDITCSGKQSCETATITCPYGQSCIVNCNNARSCQSATINAQYSSRFILNDCASDLSCNGMALYFPPNNGGSRALINGGDTLSSLNDKQLDFYAIFGWYDISVINYNGNFYDNTNAIMHCLPDYRDTCKFALDSWACGHAEDSCNYPPTRQPTAAPSTNPTLSPTPIPTLIPTPTPTLKPTTTPTKKPSANPTQRPSLNPSKKATFNPSQNPSTSTSSGTLPAIEKNTTQSLYDNDDDNDTDYVERVQRESGLEQVDVLWLVTALLLSVLCFIMVILSYYMYHSRGKLNDNNANNDAHHKKAVRSRHRSLSNFKSLKRNSKSSYMSEQDQTKMNKLIISALSENSNNKYTAPMKVMKPAHLPRRKSKSKPERYRKHEMNPHNQHNNDAIANHAPKQETDAEYDQDHGHDHDVKEGAETVHVDNTLEWDENKKNQSVVINVAEASRSYPQHNPYPNGNLNQLHEHSYSQSLPYTNNAESNESKHSKLTNGYTEQESVSSAAEQPYAYYPKQKASTNGVHCSDGHPNPYLTEPQCSQIYSHAVGKLLFNHQLQQRPNTNDTNTNDANSELDGNGIHTFGPGTGRKHPGFINTKLGDIDENAVNIKVDENSNANSSATQHNHHQNTLSVEIAANKILSPLSTVTASSIAPTQEDSDSSESESDGERGDAQQSETMNIAVRTNDFPLDLGTQMQQKHGLNVLILEEAASSSSGSSSSSSSSSSSEDSSSSSSSTQYSLSSSESGEEDEELKQSEIAMCSEQKLQEWISTGAMDGHSIHGTNLNQFPYETQNQNNYNYLHHQRNVTMVIKHQNNNTLPLSNVDASASPIEQTQKVAVTVGDQMYESPFNQDLDNNVWNKHIYKSSVNSINTNVSLKKTYVECPVSVHDDGDGDENGSEKSIIDDNATTTSIATLEIQGLINV